MDQYQYIEQIVATYFCNVFAEAGLKLYHVIDGPGRGAFAKFRNDLFKLRISYENGVTETSIASLYGEEQFYDINLFNVSIALQERGEGLTREQRKVLLKTKLDFAEISAFLGTRAVLIGQLLSQDNYHQTLLEIEWLMKAQFAYTCER